MNALALASIVTLSCVPAHTGDHAAGDPPAAHESRTGPADLVTKVYELDAAAPVLHTSEYTEMLAPTIHGYMGDGEGTWMVDTTRTRDSIADLLGQLFAVEFEYEGRSLQVDDRGRAVVVAPAAVHKEIERVLAFLEGQMRRNVELRIDLLDREDGAPALPSSMALEEADKLIGPTGKSGVTLRIGPSRIALLDVSRSVTVVPDYDVEIAQAAAQYVPVLRTVSIGLRAAARAAIVPGGTRIALIVRNSSQNGPIRGTEVQLGATVTTDSGSHGTRGQVTLQALSVLEQSLALNLFVPEGKAAVIDTALRLASGTNHVALVLRPIASSREPVASVQIANARSPFEVFDASFVAPPRVDVQGGTFDDGVFPRELESSFDNGSPNAQGQAILQAVLRTGDQSWIETALAQDETHQWSNLATWYFVHPTQSNEPGKATKSALAPDGAVLAQARASEVANIAITLRRSDKTAATLAAAAMPICYGESSGCVLATETQYVGSLDVEVAQGAATADPVIHDAFDGIVLRVRPTRAVDGSTMLEISARAHVLSGALQEVDLGTPLSLPGKRGEFDNLIADERLTFAAQGGVRKISLGGSGGLVLDVELR